MLGEAGGAAVRPIHTSPRFRTTFFQEPYAGIARDMAAQGVTLALHPHEDRADGGSLYDDPAHLASVVVQGMAAARDAGLPLSVFRSGGFAFHPCLPPLLAAHGLSTRSLRSPRPCRRAAPRGLDRSGVAAASRAGR